MDHMAEATSVYTLNWTPQQEADFLLAEFQQAKKNRLDRNEIDHAVNCIWHVVNVALNSIDGMISGGRDSFEIPCDDGDRLAFALHDLQDRVERLKAGCDG
jgi:hypothetical protein